MVKDVVAGRYVKVEDALVVSLRMYFGRAGEVMADGGVLEGSSGAS